MQAATADLPEQHRSTTHSAKMMIGLICAVLLALMFIVSGGWKVLDPFKTGELLEQAKVPAGWGVIGASVRGSLELLTAILLLLPRLRKLGGLLSIGLLVFFISWIGYFYNSLVGQECSCFPIIKRSVGPGFFVGDGVMLLFALLVFFWSDTVRGIRTAVFAAIGIAIVAGASYGVNAASRRDVEAPSPIVVDGKPQAITNGKVFLFFYDPQCMHCDAAARFMSKFDWNDTRVVAIPTTEPQFAPSFLHDTGLKAGTSLEVDKLRKVFKFLDPPYGVALVDGRTIATYGQAQFTPPAPKADLQKNEFIQ